MPQNVINDGYTRRASVAPAQGIHQGITFEYRPLLVEQSEELDREYAKLPAAKAVLLRAAALSRQIVSWNETDQSGKPVPHTAEVLRRLPPILFWTINGIIIGTAAGDPLPDATPDEDSEFLKAAKAEAEGKAPGTEALRADQGN